MDDDHQDIIIRVSGFRSHGQLARYHGWRIKILAELEHSGGLTVPQLSYKLNHRRPDIRVYCDRLYKDGFIEPVERWGWKITPDGLQLLFINNDNNNITTTQQQHNNNITTRQLTLAPYVDPGRSDPELAIVNVIISHYNETKQPFIFLEDKAEVCELVGFPPDVMGRAIRSLHQDRICYYYNNRKYGRLQLRLYQDFIDRMAHA